MAKSQKKSSKEVRKPKAEKAPKANASNPTTKGVWLGTVVPVRRSLGAFSPRHPDASRDPE
jgi:hypothetical protein